MNTTSTTKSSKSTPNMSAVKRQPPPPPKSSGKLPAETNKGDSTKDEAASKPKTPKRFSVSENPQLVLSQKQDKIRLSMEKALFLFKKFGKGGIVLKKTFLEQLDLNQADADLDSMIKETVLFNDDEINAGDKWTDGEDIRAAFIKSFA